MYPETVKDWISRHGGLTTDMKKVKEWPLSFGPSSIPARGVF